MNRISLLGRLFSFPFFDAEDAGGGGGIGDVSDVAHGISGDVDIMGRGDKTGEEDEAVGDDAGDQDEGAGDEADGSDEGDGTETFQTIEEDEGEGDEKDKEDDKDKEQDEEEFQGRPTLTDIKKKYPKIFKEFPDLREVLFREAKFSENFGTVEEAADASAKAKSFDTIEASLLGGDSSPIIEQLAQNDPEALAKVIDNFLPTVLKTSQDLYLRATVPVIEQLLYTVHEQGKKSGDVNLLRSAQHIANWFTGSPDIKNPADRRPAGPHPAEKKLEEERKQWSQTRFNEASGEINGAIDSELEGEILKGLDPDGKLSERQRSRLIQDIKDEIDATLGKDEAFKRQMRSLWQRAASADYPRDQRASIKSAFLARAKALVPSVRTRLRAEWFGKSRPSSDGKGVPSDNKQGQLGGGKKRTIPDSGRANAGGGARRPPSPADVDFSKTTDLDLIEGRYTRRK